MSMSTTVNRQVNYSANIRGCASCGRLFNPSNAIHTYCPACAVARKKALAAVYKKRSKNKRPATTVTSSNQQHYRVENTISQLIEHRNRLVSEICKIDAAADRLRRTY